MWNKLVEWYSILYIYRGISVLLKGKINIVSFYYYQQFMQWSTNLSHDVLLDESISSDLTNWPKECWDVRKTNGDNKGIKLFWLSLKISF